MILLKVAERGSATDVSVNCPNQAKKVVIENWNQLASSDQEAVVAIALNTQNKILATWLVSLGGSASSQVDMRCLLTRALLERANKLIVAHNHPSGSKDPSIEDINITKQIAEGCKIVGIQFIDHIILWNDINEDVNSTSLHDLGHI